MKTDILKLSRWTDASEAAQRFEPRLVSAPVVDANGRWSAG